LKSDFVPEEFRIFAQRLRGKPGMFTKSAEDGINLRRALSFLSFEIALATSSETAGRPGCGEMKRQNITRPLGSSHRHLRTPESSGFALDNFESPSSTGRLLLQAMFQPA